MELKRVSGSHPDFNRLIALLDEELEGRYGLLQKEYDQFNLIGNLKTVVVGYIGEAAVCCGCFKKFNYHSAEVKRVFVLPAYRGKGIARLLMEELERWMTENRYRKSILETGIKQPDAIRFYRKCGYRDVPNFGQYAGNRNSICLCKNLKQTDL